MANFLALPPSQPSRQINEPRASVRLPKAILDDPPQSPVFDGACLEGRPLLLIDVGVEPVLLLRDRGTASSDNARPDDQASHRVIAAQCLYSDRWFIMKLVSKL